MNIEINKRYYHITTRGSDGIDRVNINATQYYYEVKVNENYFEYENIEELKANIITDLERAKQILMKELIKSKKR